ncbi:MAG: glycoside hydrolase family 5 protein [Planctomycetota bacterium]|jgi:endoglucanase
MKEVITSRILRTILLLIAVCFVSFPADGSTEPTGIPFSRGVNLSNWVEGSSLQQIQFTKFTKQDFINIKSLGCDVIRLPINLDTMTNGQPDYTIDPLFYYFLDQIIDWAEELELHLILDNSPWNLGPTDPSIVDILVPVWMQMAEHYKDRSTYIYYEILNEPHEISDTKWNEIQQEVINAIRAVDQKHTIIVGPAGWNSFNNLKYMLEYEDDNLIYTFHFYEPFIFTHQGANWTYPSLEPLAGVPFPYDAARMPDCPPELEGTWEYELANYQNEGTVEHVKELIDIAVDFKTARDVPLLCGEFGVYKPNCNDEDRVYWHYVVRSYLEQKSIAWTGLFAGELLFEYDLNIPLIEALGLNAPPQNDFILMPDVNEFYIYLDYIAPNIIGSNYITNGILNFYSQNNPASGDYCIHWTGADLWNMISFRFSPVKDLSVLVDKSFAIDFWVRCDSPDAEIVIRFMDTNTDDPDDHPWRIIYTIDHNIAVWDGRWNHLQIPLDQFYEQGSADNGWFAPIGTFDWTATEHFEIVAEHSDLVGIHFYFDDIRVVEPDPLIDPDKAYNPYPPDGVQFIDPNVTLNWVAGFSEASHHVYFSDNFYDVNVADTSDTTGIFRSVQAATTYTPGPLELEKTYYWRVDEVEATRRDATIHKGDIWSFTTRPPATVIELTDATFSSCPRW